MNNGPFNNEDETVVFPKPNHPNTGDKKPAANTNSEPKLAISLIDKSPLAITHPSLLAMATDIFAIAALLRQTPQYDDINALKKQLLATIQFFEKQAQVLGIQAEKVKEGSFGLCVFLDEMIQKTPWGFHSDWARENLVIQCHGHGLGGEQFFTILQNNIQRPAENKQVLEVYYAILSLGFTGKYAQKPEQLEKIRTELFVLLQQLNGGFETDLSSQWKGRRTHINPKMTEIIPIWVTGAMLTTLLILAYIIFAFFINQTSDATYKTLIQYSKEPIQFAQASTGYIPTTPAIVPVVNNKSCEQTLTEILKNDRVNHQLEVVDGCIIRIRNLFASASDQIKPDIKPVLQKIAKKIEGMDKTAQVIGYTDDTPIISLRFPSNWHLSTARAANVLTQLKTYAPTIKGQSEGRSDAEPLVPNDTPENRAINRRVDIIIK